MMVRRPLPEIEQIEKIIEQLGSRVRSEVVAEIPYKNNLFPIYSLVLGAESPEAPTLAFFGGVHGLEKIGSEVILSYLQTIARLLDWDTELARRLEQTRLVFVPIVNPVGVYVGTRANGNGVDLMRNAPIESTSANRLYGGQRLSPRLPWFRGDLAQMESEALALCRVVEKHLFPSVRSIAIDMHSGFGVRDRLWFPYASSRVPFAFLAEMFALKENFDYCYPNHVYKIEPTSTEYMINGDLWDYLFDRFMEQSEGQRLFLPLTLEMGSWIWLRKSPLHLFSRWGLFHPIKPHRQQRIFRRHYLLFDFLHRSLIHPSFWVQLQSDRKSDYIKQAKGLWYK